MKATMRNNSGILLGKRLLVGIVPAILLAGCGMNLINNYNGVLADNIYQAPSGYDAKNGAVLTGGKFDEREVICIAEIDNKSVLSNVLNKPENGHPVGFNDTSQCRKFYNFNYVVTPGAHKVLAYYWREHSIYPRPGLFDITVEPGQKYSLHKKELEWSKSLYWFEDSNGNKIGTTALSQFNGTIKASFGTYVNERTLFSDDQSGINKYNGKDIKKLYVIEDLGERFDKHVDYFQDVFTERLTSCGISSNFYVNIRATTALTLEDQKKPKLDAVKASVDAYKPDAVLEISPLAREGWAKTDLIINTDKFNEGAMFVNVQLVDYPSKQIIWKKHVDFSISPAKSSERPHGADYLADALFGRLSEDQYLKNCQISPMQ